MICLASCTYLNLISLALAVDISFSSLESSIPVVSTAVGTCHKDALVESREHLVPDRRFHKLRRRQ